MQNNELPVAVIGGGPVGLAAAAHLLERGLRPVVFEAGARVGQAMRDWGHVRMFSPWRYVVDHASRRALDCSGWIMPDPGPAARDLAARLQVQVLAAARRRDAAALRRLDQALRFLAGGHTAGEEALIHRTATLPDAALANAFDRLPIHPRASATPEVRLTGIVLFEPE